LSVPHKQDLNLENTSPSLSLKSFLADNIKTVAGIFRQREPTGGSKICWKERLPTSVVRLRAIATSCSARVAAEQGLSIAESLVKMRANPSVNTDLRESAQPLGFTLGAQVRNLSTRSKRASRSSPHTTKSLHAYHVGQSVLNCSLMNSLFRIKLALLAAMFCCCASASADESAQPAAARHRLSL